MRYDWAKAGSPFDGCFGTEPICPKMKKDVVLPVAFVLLYLKKFLLK
jgi:hypothetical protein